MIDACIYPGPQHGVMSGEHYLPRALGRFDGCEELHHRVCQTCNAEIGKRVETEFLRAGPISFFRWMLGIKGYDGLPPSPFYRRAAGVPPIYMIGRAPGFSYDLLWEVEPGTENVYPLRQIVFEHPLAGAHPIPILDSMRQRPEALLDYLRERGLEHARPINAFAKPDEMPWIEHLLQAIGSAPPTHWEPVTFLAQSIALVATVSGTSAHFRAVAKIAFHGSRTSGFRWYD